MIEGKITNPMRVLKDGPAGTAETAWTAELVWPGAEFPTAEAKTAAGTEASSNVEICLENNDTGHCEYFSLKALRRSILCRTFALCRLLRSEPLRRCRRNRLSGK
jgi:hypothetical protein